MAEELPWYKDPRGIVSALAIITTVLAFFYVREKQMWEQSSSISKLEDRGEAAISEANAELKDLRARIATAERAIWELEHLAEKRKSEAAAP